MTTSTHEDDAMTPAEIAAKLTPAQIRALRAFSAHGFTSAYSAKATLTTMYAIDKRRLIKNQSILGWMFSQRTCTWLITDLGRAVLAALDAKEAGK
jgi:hypothetical protein